MARMMSHSSSDRIKAPSDHLVVHRMPQRSVARNQDTSVRSLSIEILGVSRVPSEGE